MTPVEIDIEWTRNEDLDLEVIWIEPAGFAHNLSGIDFAMAISISAAPDPDRDIYIVLSTGNGGVTVDPARGATTLTLTRDSLAAGSYVYDLVGIDGSETTLYQLGALKVTEGVSQP